MVVSRADGDGEQPSLGLGRPAALPPRQPLSANLLGTLLTTSVRPDLSLTST